VHGRSHTLPFTYSGNSNQLNLAFTTEPKKASLAYSSTWPTHGAGLVPFTVRQVPCATLVSVARMQVYMASYCRPIGSRANHQSQTFWTVLITIFLQLQRWKNELQRKENNKSWSERLAGLFMNAIANAITAPSVHGATDDCCVTNLWGLDYPVWVAFQNWRILLPTPALLMMMITTQFIIF